MTLGTTVLCCLVIHASVGSALEGEPAPFALHCPALAASAVAGTGKPAATLDGRAVAEMQRFLAGYHRIAPEEIVTGISGTLTARLLAQFQAEQGLPNSGGLDAATAAVMQQVCSEPQPRPAPPRIVLRGHTIFHVAPDGSDTSSGRTRAMAFKTLQRAYDVIQRRYDLSGYKVTLQLADGTYEGALQASGPLLGQRSWRHLLVRGNPYDPTKVLIRPAGELPSFTAAYGAMFALEGVKMDHSNTRQDMIMVGQMSTIAVSNVEFGHNFNPFNHITVAHLAYFHVYGHYTISGGGQTHIDVANGSSLYYNTNGERGLITVTLKNNPDFYAGFMHAASNAAINAQGITWIGTARGPRYVAELNGVIDSGSPDPDYLPGDRPGIVRTGGRYLARDADQSCHPVRITSPLVVRAVVGQPFRYQVRLSRAKDTFSARGLPPGVALDNTADANFQPSLIGVPTEPGLYEVVLRTANVCGSDTRTLHLSVEIGAAAASPGTRITEAKPEVKQEAKP